MKNKFRLFILIFVCMLSLTLTSCKFIDNLFGSNDSAENENYNDEFKSSTGKWVLKDDTSTYFTFDGDSGKMNFSYYENNNLKYSGKYRAIYRGNGEKVITPLTFILNRSDKEKEDWLNCYVDDFKDNFTQFTIMLEEEDLGVIDGTVYTDLYRLSDLPYKMGVYILEGNTYKVELNNYSYKDEYMISNGTYELSSNETITFFYTMPYTYQLFSYVNDGEVVEGYFLISEDKKTIYLYIEHDPYEKVTNADKHDYDTTFSIHYPPDFYLRGDFSFSDKVIINDLYHHTYSKTEIKDSVFVFGTYYKK